jgi:iron complex transport system substrate-binding protein
MMKLHRNVRLLPLLLVVMLLLAAGCASGAQPDEADSIAPSPTVVVPSSPTNEPTAEPTSAPMIIQDGLGREVQLEGPAQHILSMAPSNTELLFAIGAGGQIVGRDEISDYPPEAAAIASIGSTYGELNTEAILALEPDLVLAATITSPEQIQTLENLGLRLYLLPNPMTFDELFANVITVGKLTGHESEAQELAESLQGRVQDVTSAMEGVEPVRVFYEVDGTDPSAPWTTGRGTFQDVLIGMVGGENIAGEIDGWGQISLESIVTSDPAVIFFASGPWIPTTTDSLIARTGWESIRAVQDGRVYEIDTNWIDRPGPRLVDALERMAQLVHPEKFE